MKAKAVDSASIETLCAEMQILRLNVLPPYTYDEDEGQSSDDEYIAFYRKNADTGLKALRAYIEELGSLFESPISDESFQRYVSSRATFVSSLPFCKDEMPLAGTPNHKQVIDFLRYSFETKRITQDDIDPLRRYESLLIELQGGMAQGFTAG